ncbi:phage replisome organizer N-terminal domain-containing protein [Streptococcus suis]|uniref:phage replisome organizer N-terminal domain-containing protein n=1 Tax=Streptococcus suis TaxID=1307 RepID=UPI003D768B22
MASEIKWIKIVTDIFDDEKILLIESLPEADTIIVVWFKLLTLAGKQNYSGVLMMNDRVHYTDEMLSTLFRRPLNTVRAALQTFEQFGMIEIINNAIAIPNWEKHQSVDGMDKAREQARKRVARHREKQKLLASGNVTCNVTVTQGNALEEEREEEREEEIDKDISSSCLDNKYDLQSLFSDFESSFGRLLSPFEIEDIQKTVVEDGVSEDLVREALKEAVFRAKPFWNYVRAILRNWKKENIHTVEQVRDRNKEIDISKEVTASPEFFDAMDLWKE